MKKQLLKAVSLILVVSMLCSCTAQESISSSAPEISSVPETTSTSATSGNDETSEPETEDISKDETTTTETTTYDISETTTTETTTPPETEASTPVPETAPPAPLWTETEVNKTMYVTVGCYSRKDAIQGAETVSLYNVNDKVKIIAETNTGYCKLENGAFIHKDYLSNNKVVITTTTAATTPKPDGTKPITTTQTTTTEVQTPPVETPPIEYNTRTEEIKAYYYIPYTIETKFTKNNINDFKTFISVSEKFFSDSTTGYNEDGNVCFYNYKVWYNLDTNEYEQYVTDSLIEKIILISLLNEKYINDETLNKILGIYTYEELKGLVSSLPSIIRSDMNGNRLFEYSKIIVDDNLKTLLIDIQNSCINGDHKTVENLCNINFGKYNATVDLLLMMYARPMDEIDNLPTDKTPSEMSVTLVDDMGIYDRLHS